MKSALSLQTRATRSLIRPSSRESRLPSRIPPFDFGNSKDQITRALELNRQLLLASKEEPLVDEPVVRDKIDDLLGRLLQLD
ncbi:MAG: hypothetical protein ABEL97_06095 [Salinibacter sp.]